MPRSIANSARLPVLLDKIKSFDWSLSTAYPVDVRSYKQYCGLARALDLIGDRWILLIVRELLRGPRRYGELVDGLPGIATNLLAERLRTMQSNGLLAATATEGYALTKWGQGLGEVIVAIGRWATPLMGQLLEGDSFRGHWIVHPIGALFAGVDRSRPDMTVEIRCDAEPMTLCSAEGRVVIRDGPARAPDVVLTGPPEIAQPVAQIARTAVDLLIKRMTGKGASLEPQRIQLPGTFVHRESCGCAPGHEGREPAPSSGARKRNGARLVAPAHAAEPGNERRHPLTRH